MDYDRVREIAAGILMALINGGAVYGIYRPRSSAAATIPGSTIYPPILWML